ncbi:MAG: efflux RND transporter permease subunit, partial [Acidobacteriota bacterium]
ITRVIDIYADTAPGKDTGSVVAEIEARLDASPDLAPVLRPSARGAYFEVNGPDYAGKGYSYELRGEVHQMRDAFKQFRGGLGIAVILVYLVMVAHFRSFLDPLVILLAVPLGFIGVAAALYGTGTPLSVQAFMGIIMMVGIVVEYSIVLIDFANQAVGNGLDRTAAVIQAARVRLRPLLMTSLTTVLALLPMALGLAGGQANIPMARTIVGGVLGATFLSLLVVPCLYVAFRPVKARAAAGLIPLLLLGLAGPSWAAPPPAARPAGDAPAVVLVAPVAAAGGAEAATLDLPGSLEPYERTDLFAKVTGYLKEMKIDLGDSVR